MTKLLKLVLAGAVALAVTTTTLSADVSKGQKLYSKKLKKACDGLTGANFATKHTQDEWEEIMEEGQMADEIKKICPNVKDKALKEKHLKHYFDFAYEYASDSGNVPAC